MAEPETFNTTNADNWLSLLLSTKENDEKEGGNIGHVMCEIQRQDVPTREGLNNVSSFPSGNSSKQTCIRTVDNSCLIVLEKLSSTEKELNHARKQHEFKKKKSGTVPLTIGDIVKFSSGSTTEIVDASSTRRYSVVQFPHADLENDSYLLESTDGPACRINVSTTDVQKMKNSHSGKILDLGTACQKLIQELRNKQKDS